MTMTPSSLASWKMVVDVWVPGASTHGQWNMGAQGYIQKGMCHALVKYYIAYMYPHAFVNPTRAFVTHVPVSSPILNLSHSHEIPTDVVHHHLQCLQAVSETKEHD